MKKSLIIFSLLTLTTMTFGQISPIVKESSLLIKDKSGLIPSLIMVDENVDEAKFAELNIKVQTKAGNIWSVLIPESSVNELDNEIGVLVMEPATRVNSMRMKLDSSSNTLKVNEVHKGKENGLAENYTGKGVIVGIVDIGMDYRHPAFYAKDSTTYRISRIWQQNNDDGTPPSGYDYGREYIGKNQILQDREYLGSHATHVAGIAAGSGIGSTDLKYQGMAPDAEIVYVSIKHYNEGLDGSALGDYVIANPAIIDAYKYIFDYAKSQEKPAVINLSWGMHTGPHDGTSLFDLATDNLIDKGLILVGAAGNEGTNRMHFNANLKGDTARTITLENDRMSYDKEEVYVDMWGSSNSVFSVSVHLMDTFGNILYESPYLSTQSEGLTTRTFNTPDGNFTALLVAQSYYVPNGKPNVLFMMTNPNPTNYNIGISVTSPFSDVHAWNSGGVYRWTSGVFENKYKNIDLSSKYKRGDTQFTVGENGGTSKSVITAGAFTAKTTFVGIFNDTFDNSSYSKVGDITPFSSRGPLPDGRIKPDILAPGSDVVAPIFLEEYPGWSTNRIIALSEFNSDTFAYGAFSGTSMASPHVTGIVALMLQANPKLTSFQIKQILQRTATVDEKTGAVPNPNAGWGKINAFEAVKEAYRIVSADFPAKTNEMINIFPNPANKEFNVISEIQNIEIVEIYTTTGVLIKRILPDTFVNEIKISIDYLPSGLYFIRVNGQTSRLLVD